MELPPLCLHLDSLTLTIILDSGKHLSVKKLNFFLKMNNLIFILGRGVFSTYNHSQIISTKGFNFYFSAAFC